VGRAGLSAPPSVITANFLRGMEEIIKKVIIPIAGLGTRFLPLSTVVPKELWPLVDKPMVQYAVEEAKASGASRVIFVAKPGKKEVINYFRAYSAAEKALRVRKRDHLVADLHIIRELCASLSFSLASQEKPLGDGHAILQAKRLVRGEPCGVLFCDDIVVSKTPCLAQLARTYRTCEKPIVALKRVSYDKIKQYGCVQVERIANRLYKIKKIIEKPDPAAAPSDLVIVGKYILTPEVFDYLQKAKPTERHREIILAVVLNEMIQDGKIIYGYEFEGEWLECATKMDWMKSNMYLGLHHLQWGRELKEHIKGYSNRG